jgi:hypothetical protein
LILDVNPRMDPQEVKDYLRDNAVDLGPEGPDNLFGWGSVSLRETPELCGCATGSRPFGGVALLVPLLLAGLRRRD